MTDLTNAEKRAIWMEVFQYIQGRGGCLDWMEDAIQYEAFRRYPDPTPEPTIVTMESGVQLRIDPKRAELQSRWVDITGDFTPWHDVGFHASVCVSIGTLGQEYYDNQRQHPLPTEIR